MKPFDFQAKLRLDRAAAHLSEERCLNGCRHLMNPVNPTAGWDGDDEGLWSDIGWCISCEPDEDIEWACRACSAAHREQHHLWDADDDGRMPLCPRCQDREATVPRCGLLILDEPIGLWARTTIKNAGRGFLHTVTADTEAGAMVRLDDVATVCELCDQKMRPNVPLVVLHWPATGPGGSGFRNSTEEELTRMTQDGQRPGQEPHGGSHQQ